MEDRVDSSCSGDNDYYLVSSGSTISVGDWNIEVVVVVVLDYKVRGFMSVFDFSFVGEEIFV